MHGNFLQRVDEALQHCQWMVLVLTPNALASPYVRDEVFTALHRVNQGYMYGVIPVLAEACAPGSIPAQWDALHRYDATRDYSAALAGVLRAVGAPQVGSTHSGQTRGRSRITQHLRVIVLLLTILLAVSVALVWLDGQYFESPIAKFSDFAGGYTASKSDARGVSSNVPCVDFDASASTGTSLTYRWDFGDPASGSTNSDDGEYVFHCFTAPGRYHVTLTVRNGVGNTGTNQQDVNAKLSP